MFPSLHYCTCQGKRNNCISVMFCICDLRFSSNFLSLLTSCPLSTYQEIKQRICKCNFKWFNFNLASVFSPPSLTSPLCLVAICCLKLFLLIWSQMTSNRSALSPWLQRWGGWEEGERKRGETSQQFCCTSRGVCHDFQKYFHFEFIIEGRGGTSDNSVKLIHLIHLKMN